MSNRALQVFLSTPTLRRVAGLSLVIAAYSGLALWKELSPLRDYGDQPSHIYASMTAVLGLLLAMRTNSAYERWWEARKLWGKLVNVSRNLANNAVTLSEVDEDRLRQICELLAVFPYALKEHLRGRHDPHEVPQRFRSRILDFGHQPNGITCAIFAELMQWRDEGRLNDDRLRILDSEARELLEVCGACERILKTPLVLSYRVFLHQAIFLLLLSSPWGLVNDFQAWVIPIVFLQSYFLLGIECIAEAIEEPFGEHDDDLDLDGICRNIEQTVHEIAASAGARRAD